MRSFACHSHPRRVKDCDYAVPRRAHLVHAFSIDVIAMDADGVIVDAVSILKPWRMRLPKRGACSVLELRSGTLLLTTWKSATEFRFSDEVYESAVVSRQSVVVSRSQ